MQLSHPQEQQLQRLLKSLRRQELQQQRMFQPSSHQRNRQQLGNRRHQRLGQQNVKIFVMTNGFSV